MQRWKADGWRGRTSGSDPVLGPGATVDRRVRGESRAFSFVEDFMKRYAGSRGPIVKWAIAAGALLGMASGLRADECPQFQRTEEGGVRLHVSAATVRALQAAAPGFHPWSLSDYAPEVRSHYTFTMRQAPWAVVGDFDGDGWCDLVVDGRNKTDSYRLCAWGSAAGPRVVTLGTRRLPPAVGPSSA